MNAAPAVTGYCVTIGYRTPLAYPETLADARAKFGSLKQAYKNRQGATLVLWRLFDDETCKRVDIAHS